MTGLFKQLIQQLPSFIMIGIAIIFGVVVFLFFSYLLLWGLFIGVILWSIFAGIQYINNLNKPAASTQKKRNRVIEHDEQE